MVASVDADGAPPPELSLAWECKRWHTLPEAGGLLDQEWRRMYRMVALENIHDALYRYRTLTGKRIHELTDGERSILQWLRDEGLWPM